MTPLYHRAKGHSYPIAWNAFSAFAMWDRRLKGSDLEWVLMSPDYFDFEYIDLCLLSYIYLCWNLEAFTHRGGWMKQQEEINFPNLPFCIYYKVFLQLLLLSSLKNIFRLFEIMKRKFEWFLSRLNWVLVIWNCFIFVCIGSAYCT